MRRIYLSLLLVGLIVTGLIAYTMMDHFKSIKTASDSNLELGYVAIGDSYTIGNGVAVGDRWPNVLTKHLKESGVDISLIGNPSVSGYATQDAIRYEIPKLKQLKPGFVTLLIGANDSFSGGQVSLFKTDLNILIDQIEENLAVNGKIVLVTIPDYTASPAGQDFEVETKTQALVRVQQYNQVIKEVAIQRGLSVADIFLISQTMTGTEDYIYDGLHPSAAGYRKWEKVIYAEVERLFR